MKRQRQENNVCCLLIFWGICWDFANREQGMAYKVKKYQGKLGSHLQEESLGHSCISETDLPCSLPCIRNLVVLSLCPEVIACIIIHGLFCTLQLAFSPQEPCTHSSFTSTGGSGGGGVLSASVEYFHWKFKPMIGVVWALIQFHLKKEWCMWFDIWAHNNIFATFFEKYKFKIMVSNRQKMAEEEMKCSSILGHRT